MLMKILSRLGPALRLELAVLLAVLCIGAFWFAAVLMQPPVLEEPARIVESMNEQ